MEIRLTRRRTCHFKFQEEGCDYYSLAGWWLCPLLFGTQGKGWDGTERDTGLRSVVGTATESTDGYFALSVRLTKGIDPRSSFSGHYDNYYTSIKFRSRAWMT